MVLDTRNATGPLMVAALHNLLVVEDDPATARILADFGRSIGMAVRIAATLEEVDAALAEEEFCCVLLDKQIPFSPGSLALTSTGDTAQKRIRVRDPRRNAADQHILPILVVSGAAADLAAAAQAAFISRNFRDGATAYIPKPFDAETVTSEILAALERAGRLDHAACAALRPPAPEALPAATASEPPQASGPLALLVLDGVRIGRRMTFLVNGKRRDLQDAHFITLLLIAAERARGSEAYLPGRDAGIVRSPEIPSRIRTTAADAVPEGFSIVQVLDGGIRLHPLVAVGPIAWEAFERAANPVMQAVAARERRRR